MNELLNTFGQTMSLLSLRGISFKNAAKIILTSATIAITMNTSRIEVARAILDCERAKDTIMI